MQLPLYTTKFIKKTHINIRLIHSKAALRYGLCNRARAVLHLFCNKINPVMHYFVIKQGQFSQQRQYSVIFARQLIYYYPLCCLKSKGMFDQIKRFVVYEVKILKHGNAANFRTDSYKQPIQGFGIIPLEHKLVT